MFIILMGAPGCGKGTQSLRLTKQLGIPHLSTGEMLREMIEADTALGRRLAECVTQGKLVSDELILELVGQRLQQPDCERGCLLDGVPRNLPQAAALDTQLAATGTSVDVAVEMQVGEEELFRRLMLRAEQEGRSDDNEETVRRRMEVYRLETSPILAHYRQQGKLQCIDAVGTPEEVFRRILATLPI